MTKEQLRDKFLENCPFWTELSVKQCEWFIDFISKLNKEAKEADKEIIKNYIKAMMKFELGQNARIAPGETEYNKALFNVLDFLNKTN